MLYANSIFKDPWTRASALYRCALIYSPLDSSIFPSVSPCLYIYQYLTNYKYSFAKSTQLINHDSHNARLCMYKNMSIIYVFICNPFSTPQKLKAYDHFLLSFFQILFLVYHHKKKTDIYIVEDLREGPPTTDGGGVSVLFSITNDLSASFTPG